MLELQTQRLNFRQWQSSDYGAFAGFFADRSAARFVGGHKSPEEAWRLMATYVGHYELKGYSYLAVENKETRQLLGTVGLWNSDPWPEVELGYWLLPGAQGGGYGSEAGSAVVAYAFGVLGLKSLVSYIDDGNAPSIRLAERLGAHRDGEIELLDFGRHSVYRYQPPSRS